jgi:hypothetical protein
MGDENPVEVIKAPMSDSGDYAPIENLASERHACTKGMLPRLTAYREGFGHQCDSD